ncbi:hypothetical protein [Yinghuangia sp. YIM S10712]|uniref:hypothetical protein n=1 Tax=Yinghuangia sp. YIM S10712 TaxID=3436930 RepID=UPI003F53C4F9
MHATTEVTEAARVFGPHPDELALVRDFHDHQRRLTREHGVHKLARGQHPYVITDSTTET